MGKTIAVILLVIGFFTLIYTVLQKILHTPNAEFWKYLSISFLIFGTTLYVVTAFLKSKNLK